jgi:glycosyltransferase involved in cell wall biosynthesis
MGLRVAIDATPLSVPAGGVRRYTQELTAALRAEFPDDEFALISDQPFESSHAAPRGPLARRWWSTGIQREMSRLRTDVFHGTDFAVPYVPLRPSVLTIHDLSPWRPDIPGAYSTRIRRRTPLLLRLGIATMVIAPTQTVRSELLARFRVPPERVVVVPEGAWACPAEPVRRPRPYFLFVGSDQPRKNLRTVVEAWRTLRDRAGLVVIGAAAKPSEDELGLEYVAGVSDTELARWYAGAAALVYPSLYEGFGLPVVEAMAAGAPVIASRDPALLEVAGGSAVHVGANDPRAIAAAMEAMLDPDQRRKWIEAGRRHAAQFTWQRSARQTREVYAEAIRRFRN